MSDVLNQATATSPTPMTAAMLRRTVVVRRDIVDSIYDRKKTPGDERRIPRTTADDHRTRTMHTVCATVKLHRASELATFNTIAKLAGKCELC
jgi:hypothetical protein